MHVQQGDMAKMKVTLAGAQKECRHLSPEKSCTTDGILNIDPQVAKIKAQDEKKVAKVEADAAVKIRASQKWLDRCNEAAAAAPRALELLQNKHNGCTAALSISELKSIIIFKTALKIPTEVMEKKTSTAMRSSGWPSPPSWTLLAPPLIF